MERSIAFSLTVVGLIALLAWKSREVPRPAAPGRNTASEMTAAPDTSLARPARFSPAREAEPEDDGEEVPLKLKTSLVIEPVSPDEDRKLQRKDGTGKLTGIERVQ